MATTTHKHPAHRDLAPTTHVVALLCLLALSIVAVPSFAQEEIVFFTSEGRVSITPIIVNGEIHPDVLEYWEFFRDNVELWSSIIHHSEKTLVCAPSEEGCDEVCDCNDSLMFCQTDLRTTCTSRACDCNDDNLCQVCREEEVCDENENCMQQEICDVTEIRCLPVQNCTCVERPCVEEGQEEETCMVCEEEERLSCEDLCNDNDEDTTNDCEPPICDCIEGSCRLCELDDDGVEVCESTLRCAEIQCGGCDENGGCVENPTLLCETPIHELRGAQALYAGRYRLDNRENNEVLELNVPMPEELANRPGFFSNVAGTVAFVREQGTLTSEWVFNPVDNSDCFDDLIFNQCDDDPTNDDDDNDREAANAYLVFAKFDTLNLAVLTISTQHRYDTIVNLMNLDNVLVFGRSTPLTTVGAVFENRERPRFLPVDFDPYDVVANEGLTDLIRVCNPADPLDPFSPTDPEGLACRRPICNMAGSGDFDCLEPLCRQTFADEETGEEVEEGEEPVLAQRCLTPELPHFTTVMPEPATPLLAGVALATVAALARLRRLGAGAFGSDSAR